MEAYDVYLEICHRVDGQINKALNYDSSNHLARQCPACFSRVPDENKNDTGPFSVLVSMDGNNSLKRIHSAARGHVELPDSRHILSDRWLSAAQVNKFSNEVNGNAVCAFSLILRHHLASFSSLTMETSLEKEPVNDSDPKMSKCGDRWRNAGPESRKQMFSLFDETGVFIACCHHRTVLYVCDMIQSGEL